VIYILLPKYAKIINGRRFEMFLNMSHIVEKKMIQNTLVIHFFGEAIEHFDFLGMLGT